MPMCRACDSVLTSEEAEGGRCPICKAELGGASAVEERASARSSSGGMRERCIFCREVRDCQRAYCKIGYVNYWLFFVTSRWLRIRCPVCEECRSRINTGAWLRMLIALGMFAAPMAVCLGIYMPFFAANKDPDFQPGQSGAMLVAFGTLCFPWVLSIPLGFLSMRLLYTMRILPRLHPDTNEVLRAELGGSWGMLPSIFCYSSQPWLDGEYTQL
jgi:hypothetical protein